jgi:hypothetical protein
VKARGKEKKGKKRKKEPKKQKYGVNANPTVGINNVYCHYCIVTM